MSTKRTKIVGPAVKTRADMESLVGEIADLTIDRDEVQLELDAALKHARDLFEGRLSALNRTLVERTERARCWAEANPSEFGKFKSLELTHGTVGWRVGQPQLKTLTGWTWDRVLDNLKTLAGLCLGYVRLKEEVNKAQIITDRDLLGAEQLRMMGVRVVQEESFFVEPKVTKTEPRSSTEPELVHHHD
ncbi:MAG: host-nuclease inhibitor Gam family protein [Limisphaerales bacterium]